MTVDLADLMMSVDEEDEGDDEGECWMPVFTHPYPNEEDQENATDDSADALPLLEKEKYLWMIGGQFFKNYLTVFDERPVIEGNDA